MSLGADLSNVTPRKSAYCIFKVVVSAPESMTPRASMLSPLVPTNPNLRVGRLTIFPLESRSGEPVVVKTPEYLNFMSFANERSLEHILKRAKLA